MHGVSETDAQIQSGTSSTLPWLTRAAAAWLLGTPVVVAPEDWPAFEAEAATLAREAAARVDGGCGHD
jgi:hypothetical protein